MSRSAVYFNWEKKEKYCNGKCKTILPLDKFRPNSTAVAGPEMASHYRYICRKCECEQAKVRQALTYKSRKNREKTQNCS